MAWATAQKIVVMGTGNLLCSDDGLGVHAIRELQASGVAGVELVDAGTAVLHALPFAEQATHLLVIDAVRAGEPAGTVCEFDGYGAEECGRMGSLHALGLRSALHLLSPGRRPGRFRVIGVEPASLDYGMDLSPITRQALSRVGAEVRRIVAEWKSGADAGGPMNTGMAAGESGRGDTL